MNKHPAADRQPDDDAELSALDARANAWFDQDVDADAACPTPLAPTENAVASRRLADWQFLHVLLEEVHQTSSEVNKLRVDQALAAIDSGAAFAVVADSAVLDEAVLDEDRTVPSHSGAFAASPRATDGQLTTLSSRRRWLASAAVAAGISGLLLWSWSGKTTGRAIAAVERVARSARSLSDRQYRVTSDINYAHETQGRVESLLYVRGGERYALHTSSALGKVWMGSNGQQGWLIPILGAPIITDNPSYPAKWAHDEGLAFPDLQLTGLLDLMKQRFQLSRPTHEELPDHPGMHFQKISGECDIPDGGPQHIVLWANPITGVAQKLVVEWERPRQEPGLTRIQLDLLSETPQPDSWYEADSHKHGRPVLRKIPLLPSAR